MGSININLKINKKLFLRNPQETDLGRRIVQHSIILIDEIGLDQFTFRKLAKQIGSAEASIYRYFENKHFLFVYLLNWYWEWMKFRINYNTLNIKDPIERLKIAIRVIVDTANRNTSIEFVDEDVLHRIVVSEGTKGYHTKSVDKENRNGFFLSYKSLCLTISEIIKEVNPDFNYPRTLASTLVETANNTVYFAEHLPRLTDIKYDPSTSNLFENVICMLEQIAFGALNQTSILKEKKLLEQLNKGVSRKNGANIQ